MSSARKKSRNGSKSNSVELIDPSKCGDQIPSVDATGKLLVVASTWVENDYIVTIPMHVPHWRNWPPKGTPGHSRCVRMWRRTTYSACAAALSEKHCGYDFKWNPKCGKYDRLHDKLGAIGYVWIHPGDSDDDSYMHTMHHVRDGSYDLWSGFRVNKAKMVYWLGSANDNKKRKLHVPMQYNQLAEGDAWGVRIVFRFNPNFRFIG